MLEIAASRKFRLKSSLEFALLFLFDSNMLNYEFEGLEVPGFGMQGGSS